MGGQKEREGREEKRGERRGGGGFTTTLLALRALIEISMEFQSSGMVNERWW
jgi:hypothetical protein